MNGLDDLGIVVRNAPVYFLLDGLFDLGILNQVALLVAIRQRP